MTLKDQLVAALSNCLKPEVARRVLQRSPLRARLAVVVRQAVVQVEAAPNTLEFVRQVDHVQTCRRCFRLIPNTPGENAVVRAILWRTPEGRRLAAAAMARKERKRDIERASRSISEANAHGRTVPYYANGMWVRGTVDEACSKRQSGSFASQATLRHYLPKNPIWQSVREVMGLPVHHDDRNSFALKALRHHSADPVTTQYYTPLGDALRRKVEHAREGTHQIPEEVFNSPRHLRGYRD